jgi:hypothetical protein
MKDLKLERQIDMVDTKFKIALEGSGISSQRGDPATSDQLYKVARILWDHTLELVRLTSQNQ